MSWPVYEMPIPSAPGFTVTGTALELTTDYYVQPAEATDEDWQTAAAVSAKRVKRCREGSPKWCWHTAVVAECERRRRARFTLLRGGAQ